MRTSELFRSAFESLMRNRRRSLLSMLGIVIGIAAVVMILSISAGFQQNLNQTLTRGGSGRQTGTIYFNAKDTSSKLPSFTEADVSLAKAVPGVAKAKIQSWAGNQQDVKVAMGGTSKRQSWVLETVTHYNKRITRGRGLTAADNDLRHRYAVVSTGFATRWAKHHNQVVGSTVNLAGFNYQIVGVFRPAGGVNLFTNEAAIYVPKNAYAIGTAATSGNALNLTLTSSANSKRVLNQVAKALRKQGSAKNRGSYEVQDNAKALAAVGKILKGITTFIGAIAGISLFIAGIGVMNMTYISVAERMPEIGIRRALGAKPRDITNQFLLEGTMLTAFGGLIGYLVGSLLAVVVGHFLPFPVHFEGSAFWLAFLVSTAIGLLFSVGPARSATKKNLLELLR